MTEQERDVDEHWRRVKEQLDSGELGDVPDNVRHLLRVVAEDEDSSVTCEECRALLPGYVDAEVGGLPVAEIYPQMKQHLKFCLDCEAAYSQILRVATLEDTGALPALASFSPPDLSFLPRVSFVEYVGSLARMLVRNVAPDLQQTVSSVQDFVLKRIETLGTAVTLRSVPQAVTAFGGLDPRSKRAAALLLATFAATRSLISDLAPDEIRASANAGRLAGIARKHAEQAGRAAGLRGKDLQAFAGEYSDLIAEDPQALLAVEDG